MKATHSQVQCAATANSISRLKLRTQKIILTSTKKQEMELGRLNILHHVTVVPEKKT